LENQWLCLFITGEMVSEHWKVKSQSYDIYFVKSIVDKMLSDVGIHLQKQIKLESITSDSLDQCISYAVKSSSLVKMGKVKKDESGNYELATAELFSFSKKFIDYYMPYTIELGRSFVQPKYQPRPENRKGLFSLDNLWDGLGAIHIDYPQIKYFFGKVTMYPHFQREARDMILHFMNYFFPDKENLVSAIYPLKIENDMSAFTQEIKGLSYKEAHKILNQHVRARGENIPPLVNAYMNLSATMRTFGTSVNEHFGDVEETGILVTLNDIYESKKERHVKTYVK